MIAGPRSNVRPLEEVTDMVGRPDEVVAASVMHMRADLTGPHARALPEGRPNAL